MRVLLSLLLHTYRELLRNKTLPAIIFFSFSLIGASFLFGSVTVGGELKIVKDFGLFSLAFFGSLLAIIGGGSLLEKELRQKTIYNVLSKPVERWEYILGKFGGLLLTSLSFLSFVGSLFVCFLFLIEGKWPNEIVLGLGFIFLEVTIVCAVTIFFSSIVVTPILGGLFSFSTYLAGRSLIYLQSFFQSENGDSQTMFYYFLRLVDIVVPDLSSLNVSNGLVHGILPSTSLFLMGCGYTVLYCVVLLLLSIVFFSKREFP